MSLELARRAEQLQLSSTMRMVEKINQLKYEGKTIIPFNIGEPDFITPQPIRDAIVKALSEGQTKYVETSGILALKQAISTKFLKDNKLNYVPEQIIVTNGAKQALFEAITVLLNDGDEVIIPTPCWVSYEEMVKVNGGKCIFVPTKKDYQLDLEAIKKAINNNTKLIIINSPNNPTGAVYDEALLQELADLIIDNDCYIISDEVYEKLIYDDLINISIASLNKEIYQRTITINGFSKSHAMTGIRLGYLAGPIEIINIIRSLQTHLTSNVCTPVQYAGIVALEKETDFVSEMAETFAQRRAVTLEYLAKIPNISYSTGQGAFYILIDISYYLNSKIKNSDDLSMYLLEHGGIALMSGTSFQASNCLRMSYSTSIDNIKKGLTILKELLLDLQ